MRGFSVIAAVEKNFGIGKDGKIPWDLPSDMKHFTRITKGTGRNIVIMGRTTWESLPAHHKPLKDRINIVISRNTKYSVPSQVFLADSLDKALYIADTFMFPDGKKAEEIHVIGGAQIYNEALRHPACERIYLTEIDEEFKCDAFFPKFDKEKFKKIKSEKQNENNINIAFSTYEKV